MGFFFFYVFSFEYMGVVKYKTLLAFFTAEMIGVCS